jgi:hypothetical protein
VTSSGLLHWVPINDSPLLSGAGSGVSVHSGSVVGTLCSCAEAAHGLLHTLGLSVITHSILKGCSTGWNTVQATSWQLQWLLSAGQKLLHRPQRTLLLAACLAPWNQSFVLRSVRSGVAKAGSHDCTSCSSSQ